jgi:hypothetical protein
MARIEAAAIRMLGHEWSSRLHTSLPVEARTDMIVVGNNAFAVAVSHDSNGSLLSTWVSAALPLANSTVTAIV